MADAYLGWSGAGGTAAFLVDGALRGTVWLLLVFGAVVLLRRSSAAARHLVWVVGVVGLVVVPLASGFLPWRLPVLPGASSVAPEDGAVATRTLVEREAGPAEAANAAAEVGMPGLAGPVQGPVLPEPDPTAAAAARALVVDGATGAVMTAPAESAPGGMPSPWALVVGVWVVGAIVVLLRLLGSMLAVRRLVRSSEPVESPEWELAVLHALTRFGVGTTELRRSGAVAVPMTAGLSRPVVLLPAEADGWTPEQRRAVLMHEAAHIHRGDLVVSLAARVVCALYWFHPLVWAAVARLRAESERACDDHVLSAGTLPSTYADHLLRIVQGSRRDSVPAVAIPFARRSEFEGRLLAILEAGPVRRGLTRLHAAGIVVTLLVAALPLTALAPAGAPEPVATPASPVASLPAAVPETDGTAAAAAEGPATADAVRQEPVVPTRPSPESPQEPVVATRPSPETAPEPVPEPVPEPEPVDEPAPVVADAESGESPAQVARRVAALSAVLRQDAEAEVRQAAVKALGELQDTGAVAALAAALQQDADAEVRRMSAWSLGQIEAVSAVPALGAALTRDQVAEVRRTAAWALGQIEDVSGVDALLGAIDDTVPAVRQYVAWALGQIEDVRAVEPVARLLDDVNVEVRRRAAWALSQFEDPRALEPLMRALRDDDAEVRARAADALGDLEDPRAAPALAAALSDPVPDVRKEAADALRQVNITRAPEELIAAAADEDAEVRQYVARSLGDIGDPAAVSTLEGMLQDPELDVRRQALRALGEIGGDSVVDVLIRALQDDDPEIRRLAAQALGRKSGW